MSTPKKLMIGFVVVIGTLAALLFTALYWASGELHKDMDTFLEAYNEAASYAQRGDVEGLVTRMELSERASEDVVAELTARIEGSARQLQELENRITDTGVPSMLIPTLGDYLPIMSKRDVLFYNYDRVSSDATIVFYKRGNLQWNQVPSITTPSGVFQSDNIDEWRAMYDKYNMGTIGPEARIEYVDGKPVLADDVYSNFLLSVGLHKGDDGIWRLKYEKVQRWSTVADLTRDEWVASAQELFKIPVANTREYYPD